MAKTYVPRLLQIVHMTCVYITRYRETILKYLPSTAVDEFNSMADACEDFLTAMANYDNLSP